MIRLHLSMLYDSDSISSARRQWVLYEEGQFSKPIAILSDSELDVLWEEHDQIVDREANKE